MSIYWRWVFQMEYGSFNFCKLSRWIEKFCALILCLLQRVKAVTCTWNLENHWAFSTRSLLLGTMKWKKKKIIKNPIFVWLKIEGKKKRMLNAKHRLPLLYCQRCLFFEFLRSKLHNQSNLLLLQQLLNNFGRNAWLMK